MKVRTWLLATPLGAAAATTLGLGSVGIAPVDVAFADSPPLPTASLVNNALVITGTVGADDIGLRFSPDGGLMAVDFGGAAPAQTFDSTTFTRISVSLGDGDDTFFVSQLGQFSTIPLAVNGGAGDDTIKGSQGADVLAGGAGNDIIRGDDGNDLIRGGAGNDNVDGERGNDTEHLGDGADTALWIPGEASDVIDGGLGHDGLTFVGSAGDENFALTAHDREAVLTRNLGGVRMDLTRVELLDLAALAGVDHLVVGDLSGTDLRSANVDLSLNLQPDGQLDTVSVVGTGHSDHVAVRALGSTVDVAGLHTDTQITGNDKNDRLAINTGAGNDSVFVGAGAAQLIGIDVNLGAGES